MKSFMEIGRHVFPKSGTQTHRRTDRRGSLEMFCLFEKRPFTVKFSKFCTDRFHRDIDRRIVRCLPDKKLPKRGVT